MSGSPYLYKANGQLCFARMSHPRWVYLFNSAFRTRVEGSVPSRSATEACIRALTPALLSATDDEVHCSISDGYLLPMTVATDWSTMRHNLRCIPPNLVQFDDLKPNRGV